MRKITIFYSAPKGSIFARDFSRLPEMPAMDPWEGSPQ